MRNRPRRKGSTFVALIFFASAAALSVVITLATSSSGTPQPAHAQGIAAAPVIVQK